MCSITARDRCAMGVQVGFMGVGVGSAGRQAWLWPLNQSGPAAALGGRQRFCTSEDIRAVRLLQIDFGAVAHRAMWGYGDDPPPTPADINPIWVWRRASQPDQPALQPTAIITRLVSALVVKGLCSRVSAPLNRPVQRGWNWPLTRALSSGLSR
jgi:hypothetical protein